MANIDVGSLKLQFNNEVLKVKKYILQAKTQLIHKLTRNVEKMKKKKGTEEEIKKFKTKTESIVTEIIFVKKIQHNDLARFAIKNFDNLDKVMNTPIVTEEKAMAKLLSHKCLKSRFQEIVNQFSIVPADTLLQVNPKKLQKKENKKKAKLVAKTAQSTNEMNQSSAKESKQSVKEKLGSATGESDKVKETVERRKQDKAEHLLSKGSDLEFDVSDEIQSDGEHDQEHESCEDKETGEESDNNSIHKIKCKNSKLSYISESEDLFSENSDNEFEDSADETNSLSTSNKACNSITNKTKNIKTKLINGEKKNIPEQSKFEKQNTDINCKPVRKQKKMFVDLDDNEIKSLNTEKTVDSFFVTDSGDNYLTQSLPREPDPKPAHSEDSTVNRKMRRAALFGNEIISKRVNKPNKSFDRKFEKLQNYEEHHQQQAANKRKQFQDRTVKEDFKKEKSSIDEKLHPSWEAKKKKSSLVAFEGKKVIFDE